MREKLTKDYIEGLLTSAQGQLAAMEAQAQEAELSGVKNIYLAGTGAGYACALTVKTAFAKIPGLTGEDVRVVTPSHLYLTLTPEQREQSLAVLFGQSAWEDPQKTCKKTVRISEAGDIKISAEGTLEEYIHGVAAGLLLASKLCGKTDMLEKIREALEAAKQSLAKWEQQAESTAQRIGGPVDAHEIVGTGSDYGAAFLVRQLFYENHEGIVTVEESEDWLHVNMLALPPEGYAALVLMSADGSAADRTLRTIGYISGIGRRTVVYSDLPASEFEDESLLVGVPSCDELCMPMVLAIPAALLAGRL